MKTYSMDVEKAGDESEFDILVSSWNRSQPRTKNARRRDCFTNGHSWARVVADGEVRYKVCQNCLTYDTGFQANVRR